MPPLLLAGCLALFAPLLIGGGESLIIFVGEHDVALKTLPPDEIALALRTDRIDGAESTLPTYVDSGYYQLAPYWTYDRHSYNADVLVASSETWETFSQGEQTIIERCAAEAASWQRDHWQSAEVRAMLHASRSGCYMALLDEEQAEKFRAAVQPIYEHLSDAQKEVVQAVQALADSD